jgi:hypothetical protein
MFCKVGIHKWSRWELVAHGNVVDGDVVVGYHVTQRRYCKSCGKADIVTKKTTS